MDTEFHYWITGILARRAGLEPDESELVAFSSQFVDDNDLDIEVFDGEDDPYPSYVSQVSQTMNILRPKRELMRIYPVFHFIPGDPQSVAPRKDGTSHPLNTTPDSSYAKEIVQYAVQSAASRFKHGDRAGLLRLGIALHGYADTWAHQNFAGCDSDFNAVGKNLVPDVGHADALHHPDWVGHRWTDSRLVRPNIDNNLRFLNAARAVHSRLVQFLQAVGREPHGEWQAVEEELATVFGETHSGSELRGAEERGDAYRQAAPFLPEYSAHRWLGGATERRRLLDIQDQVVEKYVWKKPESKASALWHQFQEAVKEHLLATTRILQPAFEAAGMSV